MDVNLMDGELSLHSKGARTLVLLGRTGNGKSATGNSILGERKFKSKASTMGVTGTCESQTVKRNGQIINVIDTPGLFDSSVGSAFVGQEIGRCVTLAEGGIHAVLLVFSVRGRLSQEEGSALPSLQTLFGNKIINYIIVVFTGGDELEDNKVTLEEYLEEACPEFLKRILELCNNRVVLFNNKTKDKRKQAQQVEELMSLVESVVQQNSGKPYTHELFNELIKVEIDVKDKVTRLEEQVDESSRENKRLKERLEYAGRSRCKIPICNIL